MRSAHAVLLPTAFAVLLSAQEPVRLRVEGRTNAFASIAAERSFVAVAWGATAPDGGADVYLSVSRDAGKSFATPVRVNEQPGIARVGGELPARVSLVATENEPLVVITWGAKGSTTDIRFSASEDGGRSFGSYRMNLGSMPGDRGWHATTVDRSGTAHTIWLDHRALAMRPKTDRDHHGDGVDMAQFSGLYYSAANPRTALPLLGPGEFTFPPKVFERELAKGVCYCCKTALMTASDGSIYAAWRHVYPNNIRDIAFTVSRDGGKTFQAPERVSQDNWQLAGCPDDGPAMAAGNDGSVHLVWPTVVREDHDGDVRTRGAIFYSSTSDGRRFASRIEVPTMGSPKPSHPQITSDGAGGFVVGWDEVRDGVRRAFARRLRFNSAQHPMFGESVDLDPQGSAYPVFASTTRGVFVAWTHGVGVGSEIRVRRLD